VDFRILGPLEIWDDDLELPVAGDRQRALLAILLLHAGEPVAGDRLMDELWGDEPPSTGATALRVRVSQLRKALRDEGELITARAHGYMLAIAPEQLDLSRFERLVADGERALRDGDASLAGERLRDALALWRGPPLADFTYAPFAQPAIARLNELRLAAIELRIEADLRLGRHAAVAAELEALVADHPLRERFWAQLMLALYRAGRQADALAAYRSARERLVGEVGIEPGAELQDLERRILAQDPELGLEQAPASRGRTILVIASPAGELEALLAFAEPLADRPGDELLVATLVGEDADLAAASARAQALRRRAATVRVATFVSRDRGADAVRLAGEHDAALLVLELGDDAATVLARASCDVALIAGGDRAPGKRGVDVAFGGHDHDWAAVELGAWLAGTRHVPLRLLGTRADPASGRRDASRLLASASLALQRGLGIDAEPVLVAPGAEGLMTAAAGATLLVLGLSDRWVREGPGAVRLTVAQNAACPVVLVRRGLRPGGLAPPAARTRFTWSAG
jgi:DNA-binding SARP family transcriptional activator